MPLRAGGALLPHHLLHQKTAGVDVGVGLDQRPRMLRLRVRFPGRCGEQLRQPTHPTPPAAVAPLLHRAPGPLRRRGEDPRRQRLVEQVRHRQAERLDQVRGPSPAPVAVQQHRAAALPVHPPHRQRGRAVVVHRAGGHHLRGVCRPGLTPPRLQRVSHPVQRRPGTPTGGQTGERTGHVVRAAKARRTATDTPSRDGVRTVRSPGTLGMHALRWKPKSRHRR